jgi:hypothetical protein
VQRYKASGIAEEEAHAMNDRTDVIDQDETAENGAADAETPAAETPAGETRPPKMRKHPNKLKSKRTT